MNRTIRTNRTTSSTFNTVIRRAGAPTAVLAAVFLIGGCGGAADKAAAPAASKPAAGAAAPAAGAVLDVTGAEFSFAPAALKAPAGKTTIRFVNKGIMEHDYSIEALKIHITAAAGKTAEAVVTLKPGTYKSLCSVPGHLQSGMRGTLTVS